MLMMRQDGLRHADDAEDVDVEDRLGRGYRILLGGARRADTGVVDQHIDSPEPLDYLTDRRGDRVVTGHVEVQEGHTLHRGELCGVAARSDHLEPCLDKGGRSRLADACCAARHECYRPICRHPELLTQWIASSDSGTISDTSTYHLRT